MGTNSNTKKCKIKIDNFENNEIVEYEILTIKGRLKQGCENPTFNTIVACGLEINTFHNKFNFLFLVQNLHKNIILFKTTCCQVETKLIIKLAERNTVFTVTPIYIICNDHSGYFQAPENINNSIESACKRIALGAKLLQCLYAEKLYESSLGRKTFQLCLTNNNQSCTVFQSALNKLDARKMKPYELWTYFGREIINSSIYNANTKYLAFLSCTKYCGELYKENVMKTHEDLISITEGYVALGGGGLAIFGGACLYVWPEKFEDILNFFQDKSAIDKTKFLDDTCYRGTYGACFTTTLGSVCHELGHAFDLGHTKEGIMGRGFDNIDKVFISSNSDETFWTKSCSVLLSNHRWFNDYHQEPRNIVFNKENKVIKSTSGLKVIEIRSAINDEMVLHDWTFMKKPLRFDFQIVISEITCNENKLVIVVENDTGFILKETFTI